MSTFCSRQKDRADRFKCGEEFLPSPLASTPEFALMTEPTLVRKGHVTAVAVAVEMEHAVAFLGTATGEVSARTSRFSRPTFSCRSAART